MALFNTLACIIVIVSGHETAQVAFISAPGPSPLPTAKVTINKGDSFL